VDGSNSETQEALVELAAHREPLLRLCYRMTGSSADAEDVVQETFARALARPPADLGRDLRPWLVRVAMNLSRDALRARRRRGYVGTWLPSPHETAAISRHDPEARYGELESVTFAFLLALEALGPNQRAVLLLRDVLDYSVQETAAALELSEANVKTTLHRARAAMAGYDATRMPPTPQLQRRTRDALVALVLHLTTGNDAALEALLAADVRARNDGNGEFFAARKPVLGLRKVILFHRKVQPRLPRDVWQLLSGASLPRVALLEINGLPALVSELQHPLKPGVARRSVVRVELGRDGRIAEIDSVVASGKLQAIAFDRLERVSLRHLASVLFAGCKQPPPWRWLLPAARRLWTRAASRLDGAWSAVDSPSNLGLARSMRISDLRAVRA
jgi:RNA polymerase sigma factor (sigma-70 family)